MLQRRATRMMPHLRVRPATVRDIRKIMPLWEELATLHGDLDPALAVGQGAEGDYAEFLGEAVRRPDTCVMLGEADGRLVAFAVGRIQVLPLPFREQRRGWIQDVCTAPDRRRQGIGRRVVEALLAWFDDHDVTLTELTVAVRNPEAIRFWERLGFETYMYRMKRAVGRR